MRELSVLYEAARVGRSSPLEALPVQYADFSVWQRGWLTGEVEARSLAFWKGLLTGAPPALELLPDRPRPVMQSYRGRDFKAALPPALAEALGSTARRLGATRYMVWLAA
ncbi:MAG: hypothetical protein KDD47_21225, partial [Acidobacteria bacterium]|nr:hypothetical protein [Acidobacteriota bacterium]